jgi:hypothetical protein
MVMDDQAAADPARRKATQSFIVVSRSLSFEKCLQLMTR